MDSSLISCLTPNTHELNESNEDAMIDQLQCSYDAVLAISFISIVYTY